MKIVVCVKPVVDPEEPPQSFTVDEAACRLVLPPGVPQVISPFDKHAVEAALRIKDTTAAQVVALSLGAHLDRAVLRDPIAMGADALVLVEDDAFADSDSWSTAHALAMAIGKIGDVDLILCGRQASDTDGGQTGIGIAELLGIPCVTLARKIQVGDGLVRVERVLDDGYEAVEVAPPALITVSNEVGEPRHPTIRQVMAAKRLEPQVWHAADIGAGAGQSEQIGRHVTLVRLFQPAHDGHCEFIRAATPAEAGARLADRLRDEALI